MTNPKNPGIPILLTQNPKRMLPYVCFEVDQSKPTRRVSGRCRSFLALLLRPKPRAAQADMALAFDTLPERWGSTVSSTLAGLTKCVKKCGKVYIINF